jgi:hypothetical protein
MVPRTDAEVIVCSFESPASFGELFDRHATTMFRYFVRRVGPDDADSLLGELFRIAFEKRAGLTPNERRRGPGCTGSRAISWPDIGKERLAVSRRPLGW